jgi:GMP synthase-like glutamine amidotransferase
MPRVLFLRHHPEDSPGLIGRAFVEKGFELDVVLFESETSTPSLDDVEVLVVGGSKCAVYDQKTQDSFLNRELELIREAGERGIPVLGICFGAQALCHFHGGSVRPAKFPEVGWYDVTPSVGSLVVPGPWFEFHFDECVVPEHAEVLATTGSTVQAFTVGRNFAVQFHPEVEVEQLRDWLNAGADDDAREFGLDVEELLEQSERLTPGATQRARDLVGIFLEHAGL